MKNKSNDRKEADLVDVTGGGFGGLWSYSGTADTQIGVNDGNQRNPGDDNVSVGKDAQVTDKANINTGTQNV